MQSGSNQTNCDQPSHEVRGRSHEVRATPGLEPDDEYFNFTVSVEIGFMQQDFGISDSWNDYSEIL